ncbi:MAG: hypothetical protein PUK49_10710 [Oscillospiraceae bacterium]|nr:hypothetical protein [Oscillospiraceae bacterium]
MKKSSIFSLLTSMVIAASMCGITSFAEDYEADVSSAEKASDWGQSFKLYSDVFDPASLNEDSEIIVEYTLKASGEGLTLYPVELIAQSWEVTDEETGELISDGEIWGRIEPSEYDESHAVFTYEDILAGYKAAAPDPDSITDLSGVLCINVGATNQGTVLCTKFTVTNSAGGGDSSSDELTGINSFVPVTDPAEYNGSGEIFRVTKNDFDATRLNSGSEVVIYYEEMSSAPAFCPVNLVLISTENTTVPENKRDEEGNVAIKMAAPLSYDSSHAVFTCKQVLSAYGTGNFSELYDFSIVGTSQAITVTGVEFTNVNQFGTRSVALSEAEAAAEKKPVPMWVIIVVIAVVVVVILIGLLIYAKVNSNRAYDISSGSYVRKSAESSPEEKKE